MKVSLIGITGGSGSGKSTVVRKITEAYSDSICIAQDNYYKSATFVNNDNITSYNFDRPEALDLDLMYENLVDLKNGKSVDIPQYDFVHHARKKETMHIEPKRVIIVDGLMVLYDERIRNLLDLKLYVDTPADIRFVRRLQRDIKERGRTVDSVIEQYVNVVRPGHEKYIEPCKAYADLIIPEGGYNENALFVLVNHVQTLAKNL
ncbi:MAG: uridine kinase [Spirochaetales bacterium]|nr:uridine kinase [Spirochaetales bacterium]